LVSLWVKTFFLLNDHIRPLQHTLKFNRHRSYSDNISFLNWSFVLLEFHAGVACIKINPVVFLDLKKTTRSSYRNYVTTAYMATRNNGLFKSYSENRTQICTIKGSLSNSCPPADDFRDTIISTISIISTKLSVKLWAKDVRWWVP